MMKKIPAKYPWQFWAILITAVMVQVVLFCYKGIFHIDELFSYGLANRENGVYLFNLANEIDDKLLSGDFFNNYLMPTANSSLVKLWHNLPQDNHMPIYFVLLHLFCSFFGPEFTIIPAAMLNMTILIALMFGMYHLAVTFFNDKFIALGTTLLFAFSQPVLSLEIYIRMYLLWMMFSVFLLNYLLKLLLSEQADKNCLAFILGFSLFMILTHYYGIIWAFIVTAWACAVLCLERRYKEMFALAGVMLGSVVAAYLIYPAMLTTGVAGERGGQFMNRLTEIYEKPYEVLIYSLGLINEAMYNGLIYLVVGSVLEVIELIICYRKKLISQKRMFTVLFLLASFYSYAVLSAMVQPWMPGFQIRYFAVLVAIAVILSVDITFMAAKIFKWRHNVLISIIFIIAFGNAFVAAMYQNNPYYMRASREHLKVNNVVVDADIWWGLGGGQRYSWVIHNFIDKLALSRRVWTLVDYDGQPFRAFAEEEKKEGRYAYLMLPKSQEISPASVVVRIKEKTGRKAYYMFTVHADDTWGMAFEASVFLVAPY